MNADVEISLADRKSRILGSWGNKRTSLQPHARSGNKIQCVGARAVCLPQSACLLGPPACAPAH
eukprot:2518747-Prymnesium_polylepis.1